MARKRMISPEIWDNQGFGELSMLAKLLFIGMISQADDDGKGILSAQYLKSRIFPYNELRRADIEKALNEIGQQASPEADGENARDGKKVFKLSVRFYEADGKSYYMFENWRKWQSICRPIPSKLPNPPLADGEGGGMPSYEVFNDNSMSTHEQLNEYSNAKENIKEKNINKTLKSASARSEARSGFEIKFSDFCNKWEITDDNFYSPLIAELDFDLLDKAYSESPNYLGNKETTPWAHTVSGMVKNYYAIVAGKYKDRKPAGVGNKKSGIAEGWQALYDKLEKEDGNDDN